MKALVHLYFSYLFDLLFIYVVLLFNGHLTSADALYLILVGHTNISNRTDESIPSVGELELQHVELFAGGKWTPLSCVPRQNVAIIIPYRDREEHLRALLNILHPMIQRQLLQYTIYVVEQVSSLTASPCKS